MTAPHMPMMNDYGLLECPFCDSLEVYLLDELVLSQVYCSSCGACSEWFVLHSSAIKAWNTRGGFLYSNTDYEDANNEV